MVEIKLGGFVGNILPKENVSHHPILLPRTKANALSIIKIAHYRYLTRRILPGPYSEAVYINERSNDILQSVQSCRYGIKTSTRYKIEHRVTYRVVQV